MSLIRDNISFSSSSTFEYSRGRKGKQWVFFKFSSNWEYIVITLGCTLSIESFFGFVNANSAENEPTIVHRIICLMLIGVPLNYMQLLLGQYSQLGEIFFRHLSPIGHGLGYTMILNSLVWCSHYGIVLADLFLYFLAALDAHLDWMSCPPNTTDRCWDATSKCKKNCISEKVEVSAYVYWRETYMRDVDLNPKRLTLGKPNWVIMVPICLTWAAVFTIVNMGIDKYKKLIRANFYMVTIFATILLPICLLTEGATKGIGLMFRINFSSFINPAAWAYAIDEVVRILALARTCHMTFGSYMTPTMPSDILTIFNVLLNFLGIFLLTMITHASIGITMAEAHVNESAVEYIYRPEIVPIFTAVPLGLGFMGAAQLWTVIFIFACICLLINNLTVQIDAVQRCITDAHSSVRAYNDYILVAVCAFCCLIGFIFSSKVLRLHIDARERVTTNCIFQESFVISKQLYQNVLQDVRCLQIFIMSVLTFWVYRVQRLSDDIHFLQGAQPTKFWKICWYLIPCAVGFSYIYITYIDETRKPSSVFVVMHYLAYFILVSPIPICMCIEIFRYLAMHNLIGILQPEERWGSPDPEERHLRNSFNPRQEIRSRRRDDTCHHNCLLGSKYLKRIIAEERELRQGFVHPILDEPEEISEARPSETWSRL